MAARCFRMNKLDALIDIIPCDLRGIKKVMPAAGFDAAIFNPPYRRVGSGRISLNSEKALARHELGGTLADFVESAGYLLRESGAVYTVYPAARAVELIFRFRESGIEPKRMRMVHSTTLTGAEFVLLEAVKGGGEELEIMPPLFVYEREGDCRGEREASQVKYTTEMEGIFSELCLRQSSSGG
jgi:tRNA1Val (adenine37-N6)-methyltransferase